MYRGYYQDTPHTRVCLHSEVEDDIVVLCLASTLISHKLIDSVVIVLPRVSDTVEPCIRANIGLVETS